MNFKTVLFLTDPERDWELWEDTKAMAAALPVISLAAFDARSDGDAAARLASARALDEACRSHGFVTMKECGIDAAVIAEAFAGAQELFGMSEKAKAALVRVTPETNRGYSPVAAESLNRRRGADNKESFNVRFGDNDFSGCPRRFVEGSTGLLEAGREVCRRYTEASALALGLPVDYFSKHFADLSLCTLRFLHYPPAPDVAVGCASDTQPIRLGEHTDFGLFTCLFVLGDSSCRGLQLRPEGAVSWLDVDNAGKADCLVNTGALAARWTNDVWRATEHRVVVPDRATAAGHRYSIAFFFDPDPEALVEVHPKFCADAPPKYAPITAHDYVLAKLNDAQKG